jgi:hypothetical protein
MKLPSNLPRTIDELCKHPDVRSIVMQTYATAYSLHLFDSEDPTKIDAAQVWQVFLKALCEGYSQFDDELFERMNYSPVGNSQIVSQS